jgi:uncharacterized membrane protein
MRLGGIDTARGIAMLLVCFAHFLLAVSYATANEFQPGLLLTITAVASPTFVIISGMTFGYLMARSREEPCRMRSWLINRALLLLFPVHLLLLLAHITGGDGLPKAFSVIEITDTIGLAMLVNVWFVDMDSSVTSLAVAAVMFAGAWCLNFEWRPGAAVLVGFKDLLVRAAWDSKSLLHGFPLIPWASLHLAASVVGRRLSDMSRRASWTPLVKLTSRIGAIAVLTGVAVKLAEVAMMRTLVFDEATPLGAAIAVLASPFGKYPPSPAYFLICGGAGLVLLASAFAAEQGGWLAPLTSRVAVLGRASLCAWVVQAWVYWAVVPRLPVPAGVWLPLYFIGTLALVWSAAHLWDRNGWNRHLSLTFPRIASHRRRI